MSPDSQPVTAVADYDKVSQAETVSQGEETEKETPVDLQDAGKKQLTRTEWKNLMRLYFTVRHSRVVQCGHTLDVEREPRTHCQACWFAFLNSHGDLVNTADEVFRTYGPKTLTKLRGEKFTKNFTRFMATLAKWKEEQENATKAGPGSNGDAPVPAE